MTAPYPIPVMTHRLSSGWDQPDLRDVLLDDTHVVMNHNQFNGLPEYSTSTPTGVYEGKAWKQDTAWRGKVAIWWLCWYGKSDDPDKCSIESREILIV